MINDERSEELLEELTALRMSCDRLAESVKSLTRRVQVPEPQGAVRQRFDRLVVEWKTGRGHSSKLKELATHPAYQQIIGMGESAVPFLLEEMKERPDQWDWALRAITGTDPVPRESWGKLKEIAAAWIAWGEERGYIRR